MSSGFVKARRVISGARYRFYQPSRKNSRSPGETTPDSNYSEFTSCLGVCGVAPAIMINDQVYGNLTPEKVKEILRSL